MCPEGEFVNGFDDGGNILCAPGGEPPAPACPCFDDGDEQGVGIDFMAQVLPDAACLDFLPDAVQLGGSRDGSGPGDGSGAQDFITNAAFEVITGTDQCFLLDNAFGVSNILAVALEEVQPCIDILLASEFLSLNSCPPPAPGGQQGTFRNAN
jgi:hypothetical protein